MPSWSACKSDFTILDTDDQVRLLKQIIAAANIDEKRWPGRVLASIIDGWKNRGLTPDKVPPGEAATFANGRGRELYKAYQARLKTLNAADFGDLLLEMLRLFREHAEVLRQYQERFRYMLVDEYQDTNVAQYLWLRLLGQGTKNICCVGDDDQSIYGWRGAEVDNILRFEHDFPGATVIRLERNYRSTGHILAAASHLIAHNEGRLGKTLCTEDEPGEKVAVTGAWDSEEEARAIGEDIENLQRDGHSLDEMAILVRASFQMREFEDRFVTLGLPYRVIGGPRFYERAEIRDALAYLRARQPAGGRPRLRAHRQHAEARPRRRHAAIAAGPRARAPACRCCRRRARSPNRGAQGQAARRGARSRRGVRALARAEGHAAAHRARRDRAGRIRLHRDVAEGPLGRCAGAAGKPERARPLDGGVREPRRLPRARLAGDGHRARRGRRSRLDHDACIPPRGWSSTPCSCPAGRKACSRTSARSTSRGARGSKRSAASPMSG